MEGKGLQLGAVVPGPSNTNPGTSSVMLPVKLSDWAINLTLDESGNLMLDVARAGFTMHKIFYCNGNYDISNAVPASEETMEEVWGKVGDGKRKREEENVELVPPHKRSKGSMDLSPKFFCFNFLPPELQIRIFEFLPPRDVLSSVGRVCKDWANLLTEDSLWHTLHVQHFGRIKQGKTWKAQCKEVMQRILKQETRTQRKLFFWAARYGYVELVRSNLKQCPSLINRRNKWGIPALCKAAKKGHTDIVELLLAHPDANVNIETDLHTTALCMVADKGNVEMAKLLIAHGADVNIADNNGRTPLRRAASKGFKRTVQLLAANGADVNMADIFGRTALYRAASKGATSMVKLLLSLGADATIQDAEGHAPLYMACKMGHKETAVVLRAASEKAEAEKKRQRELERSLIQGGHVDLPPLSPLTGSSMVSTTYAPLSSSFGSSLYSGSQSSRLRSPSSSSIVSPTSSPTTSPPGSPLPLPTGIPYLARQVSISMALVNPNAHTHTHNHPHPHPHSGGPNDSGPAGYTIPPTFTSPFLFINPTTKATFVPVPTTSSVSPPRGANNKAPINPTNIVPVRMTPGAPVPHPSPFLVPSSASLVPRVHPATTFALSSTSSPSAVPQPSTAAATSSSSFPVPRQQPSSWCPPKQN